MNSLRGQTEIIGVVLLIGFVLVSASAVLVVGSSALSSVEDSSEREHDIHEMQSVSHEIENVIQSADADSSIDVQDGYYVSDSTSITIEDSTGELHSEDLQRVEHDGLVYEAGMVIEDGRVISSPNLELNDDSMSVQFPGFGDSAGSFGGDISHAKTKPIDVPDEYIKINIESEYNEAWYEQFEEASESVDSVWETNVGKDERTAWIEFEAPDDESDDELEPDTTYALNLEMSDGDLDLSGTPHTHIESYYDSEFDRHNADVETTADAGDMGGATDTFTIQGEMRSEGDIEPFEDHQQTHITQGTVSHTTVSEPIPTDELLVSVDAAQNATGSTAYVPGDDLTGGTYYAEDDLNLTADQIDVTDESVLVVDGDLILEGANIHVLEAIDLHVHGTLSLERDDEQNGGPPSGGGGQDSTITTDEAYQAGQVSVFVSEEIEFDGHPEVTGLVHATDATLDFAFDSGNGEAFTTYGAMAIDSITTENQQHTEFNLYYDEYLGERDTVYATSGDSIPVEAYYEENPFDQYEEYSADRYEEGNSIEVTENELHESLLVDGYGDNVEVGVEVEGNVLDDIVVHMDGESEAEAEIAVQGDLNGNLVVISDEEANENEIEIQIEGNVNGEILVLTRGEDSEQEIEIEVGGNVNDHAKNVLAMGEGNTSIEIEVNGTTMGHLLAEGDNEIEIENEGELQGDVVANGLNASEDQIEIDGYLHGDIYINEREIIATFPAYEIIVPGEGGFEGPGSGDGDDIPRYYFDVRIVELEID